MDITIDETLETDVLFEQVNGNDGDVDPLADVTIQSEYERGGSELNGDVRVPRPAEEVGPRTDVVRSPPAVSTVFFSESSGDEDAGDHRRVSPLSVKRLVGAVGPSLFASALKRRDTQQVNGVGQQRRASSGFPCNKCEARFSMAYLLKRHRRSAHSKLVPSNPQPAAVATAVSPPATAVSPPTTAMSPPTTAVSPSITAVSPSTSTGSVFRCQLCAKTFPTPIRLLRHGWTHDSGQLPFRCRRCCRAFRDRAVLQDHMQAHLDGRLTACIHCGAGFKSLGTLKRHLGTCTDQSTHRSSAAVDAAAVGDLQLPEEAAGATAETTNGAAPRRTGKSPDINRCSICDKVFSHPGALLVHTRTHTGERPFSCKLCLRRFVQRPHLVRHFETSHDVENPFSCELCGRGFSLSDQLAAHRLHAHQLPNSEDVASCPTPSSGVATADDVNGAEYRCGACSKTFEVRPSLLKHYKYCKVLVSRRLQQQHPQEQQEQLRQRQQEQLLLLQQEEEYQDPAVMEEVAQLELQQHQQVGVTAGGAATFTGCSAVRRYGAHQCDLCSRRFTSAARLRVHRRLHVSVAPRRAAPHPPRFHRCHLCSRSYDWKCNLKRHLRSHGDRSATEQRPTPVHRTSTTAALRLHRCTRCQRCFHSRKALMIHNFHCSRSSLNNMNGSADNPKLDTRPSEPDPVSTVSNGVSTPSNSVSTPSNSVSTPSMGGGTSSTGGGTASMGGGTASNGGGTASTGSGTVSTGSGTASMGGGTASTGSGTASTGSGTQPLTVRRFRCHGCQRYFTGRFALYHHQRSCSISHPSAIDDDDGRLYCHLCGVECETPSIMRSHLKSHRRRPKFRCTICGKRFPVKCRLDRHLKTHAVDGVYKCSTCALSFTDRRGLVKHELLHQTEGPCKCPHCSRSFNHNRFLLTHVRLSHPHLYKLSQAEV